VYATMRDLSLAGDLEAQAGASGVELEIVQLDLTDVASMTRAMEGVLASAGHVDVLVNNAAVGWLGALEEEDPEEARLVFETNFFGPLHLIRRVLPSMRERGSGTIVNVSSTAGRIPEPFNAVYSASKHALEALSESLRYELSAFGVRVVIVEPGAHATRGYHAARSPDRFAAESPYDALRRRFMDALARLPVATPGDPWNVADAIYAAASAEKPKLRRAVGEGTAEILALRKRLEDDDWEQTMRTTLDIWD